MKQSDIPAEAWLKAWRAIARACRRDMKNHPVGHGVSSYALRELMALERLLDLAKREAKHANDQ